MLISDAMRRKVALILLSSILSGSIVLVYAHFIEPNWLEVTHHTLIVPIRSPLQIAHVTDLHLRQEGFLERKLLASLETERPDLIVLTGDTLNGEEDRLVAQAFLRKLKAPLGVWAVKGNWEHWGQILNEEEFYKTTGVALLVNQGSRPRSDVLLLGFDDALAGQPRRVLASSTKDDDSYCIALFHSPQYFDELDERCTLALSGHTHGGQLKLPFLGPIWLPPGSSKYVAGWYQKDRKRMYVSRGVGTSIFKIRFLARPELAYVTLVPGNK